MLQFSLVFMLQNRGPRQKTRLMTDIITFGVGNCTILNQDGKTKILTYVVCFYSKCLAKIVFWLAASWLQIKIRPSGWSRRKDSTLSCRCEPSWSVGTLRNYDGDDNGKVKKAMGLVSKTTTLHVHHAFLQISLQSLHNYDVKLPNFKFTWERER